MIKKVKLTEEEIATMADLFFASKGWDIYPEVVISLFPGRPDLVCVKQQLCMVIECKRSLTYPVLEQLTRWHQVMKHAKECKYVDSSTKAIPHLLVAVTESGSGRLSDLKKEILDQYRIGVYEVTKMHELFHHQEEGKQGVFDDLGYICFNGWRWQVSEVVAPKIQHGSRKTAHKIINELNVDMKMGKAGTTGLKDAYMTPFKRTMNKAREILERGGEWHIASIVIAINKDLGGHHYSTDSSAKSSIGQFLIEFDIAEKIADGRPVYKLKQVNTGET